MNAAVLTISDRVSRGEADDTSGDLLEGVRFFGGGARTHSLVMAYRTKQVPTGVVAHRCRSLREPPGPRTLPAALSTGRD